MHGLTVRWSLMDCPPGTGDALRQYVREQSVIGHGPDILQEWELAGVAVGAEGPLVQS